MAGNILLFLKFLLLLVLAVNRGQFSAIDEQVCADRVQKECKCRIQGLLSAVRADESGTWCIDLQSCIDCMAVPRCVSRYLDSFRSLLLATAILSRKTRICSSLQYRTLINLVQGKRKKCQGFGRVTDQCGLRCRCQDGRFTNCYRIRKEFTHMSFEERSRFVRAFYKATTDSIYKDDFEQLLNVHSRLPSKYLHHMPQIFLPWHRWFLVRMENFLRQIDCRITIPYWQWSDQTSHLWRTEEIDVWSSGSQGLGGNGVPPSGCVEDGIFKEGKWFMPIGKGGGCLKRGFNFSCHLPDAEFLKQTLALNNFSEFESIVRDKFHNNFHDCVGRLMHFHHTASNTPEFPLHHAFIDRVWSQWQAKGKEFMFQYYTSLNYKMPVADRYPWEYLDSNVLPGDLGVQYEEYK